ncbi:hypothetical protein K5V07_00140 [Flavobacterium sp. CHNK8]|uniref:hypothetical protein n=1 Tax=Flavobacterium sp. CHNK8 TaxID=2871165 RepID=UPI001C8E4667|nr:hypothetical protein [Flavobacterium sp. CHNK8]QZK88982.1 hypothetical protein K5V07_00140 [Flavobacterium sp. CHNK8]
MNLESLSNEQLMTTTGGDGFILTPVTAGVYDNGDGNGCIPSLNPFGNYLPKIGFPY